MDDRRTGDWRSRLRTRISGLAAAGSQPSGRSRQTSDVAQVREASELVAEVRRRSLAGDASRRTVGEWATEPIRWDGDDHEITYQPKRTRVMRAGPGLVDAPMQRRLLDTGWRRAGIDASGTQLWLNDQALRGLRRLERLATGDHVELRAGPGSTVTSATDDGGLGL